MELHNKVCIVTGAASGIGKAIATLFSKHGASVIVADVNIEAARATADEIDAFAIACNVAVNADVQSMVETVIEHFGRIDVLVNNAGFGLTGNVVTIEEEDWDRLMSVNLKGMFLCAKHVVPVMARQKSGSIINTTSYTATSAIANRTAYVASKGGVSALTRAMALDHAADGIRVNAVAPGTIDSPYFDQIFAQSENPQALRAAFDARAVLNRMGQPEEIAEAFLFLASDRSRFATGSILTVDGGSSIGNHLVD
ncbi:MULTISPECIES: SDR family oxidoreductase [Pseudomonas]|uniref:SDR family oxidoreductase n=1 Tax=Pseudomonas TaxID=286 RepID=UPI000C868B3C|nr:MULTISPECIES: SDR family oxidoreductase [unclassified Pseudomonas]PMV22702.1 short-chain dehydrogenase [Pseudomonas sp. FW305-3-2-15-C-TSA2]PMV29365.1 short-chain dehydrogenase [Pseudomonas sp. DP16D-L5]PMV39268.1 short-chain dehydrogenase [Pseudomonas sp. FW305-3-2-15-A-LB2]PMV45578.1 short-chain dehydrogenase [Pseudomonas sp. FW305-3-2-15-C-R2A1]PMV51979.1 short-chain dehydrogenase [Pseudomonas sp. FW305-3-2-15-C-LB1]